MITFSTLGERKRIERQAGAIPSVWISASSLFPILHGSKTIDPDEEWGQCSQIDRAACVQRNREKDPESGRLREMLLTFKTPKQELNEPRKEEEEENKRDSWKASGGKKKTGGSFRTWLNPVMQRWKSTMKLHTFPYTTGDF